MRSFSTPEGEGGRVPSTLRNKGEARRRSPGYTNTAGSRKTLAVAGNIAFGQGLRESLASIRHVF
jgi:hypothetical protein